MEFTNEVLKSMKDKKDNYNTLYSNWYFGMSKEFKNKTYANRADRILDCMNLWAWDCYDKNKILDLQRVNRCINNRFCPNCKLLDISKFIHSFRDIYSQLNNDGYNAYMLTLTIPSCDGHDLRATIDKLNKSFRKFTEKYTYTLDNEKSYCDRLLQFDGGIKVLEITYNKKNGFHPHFHCVVFSKEPIKKDYLIKNINGKYSYKRKSVNMKSKVDCHLGKIWSMIWYKERLTNKNIEAIAYDPQETYFKNNKKCLEVDFRELDEFGIYEVFKYTFKDSDIINYYVFKTLVQALENKRIRQGFGILYGFKCEDLDEGDIQSLELQEEENPTHILTREIKELITTYRSYRKISRFNRPLCNNNNI